MKKLLFIAAIIAIIYIGAEYTDIWNGTLPEFFDDLKYLTGAEYTGTEETTADLSPEVQSQEQLSFRPVTTDIIKSNDEWLSEMNNAVYQLIPSFSIKILGYSDSKYDISTLPYNIGIHSSGTTFLGVTTMNYTLDYSSDFKLIAAEICPESYQKLSNEEKACYDSLKAKADEINNSYTTQYERELAIHDYIVLNYKYATGSYDSDRSHSIVGMMEDGTGVCQAYSDMFTILCRMCSLEVYSVIGELNGGAHGWNIVKIGDNYYHIDVTSDDPIPDNSSLRGFAYFNLSDEQISKTHKVTSKYKLPPCTSTEFNYYEHNGLVVHNQSELEQLISRKLKNGNNYITFKTQGVIIPDQETLFSYFNYRGYRTVHCTGEFEKESVYVIRLG